MEIILAETADDFCEALARLAAGEVRGEMASAGRALVRSRYDWSSVGAALLGIYEGVIGGRDGVRPGGGGAAG